MITKRTVFVLGAGASKPYGFPTGYELYQFVIRFRKEAGSETWQRTGFDRDEVKDFVTALQEADPPSVDGFLERRSEFRGIGKLLMAYLLTREEKHPRPKRFPVPEGEEDWYHYVLNHVLDGAASPDDLESTNVSFVTFNYDRSLTHYLLNKLRQWYGINDDKAREVIETRIPVVHVHGTLGGHPWQSSYGSTPSRDQLRRVAEGIKIIHENDGTHPEMEQARQLIREAQHVFFLGFGFHSQNVERLGLPLSVPPNQKPKLFGCGYGISRARGDAFFRRWGVDIGDENTAIVCYLDHLNAFIDSLGG